MKIAATCDLHYDLLNPLQQASMQINFIDTLKQQKPDVLIIAGDLVGLGWADLGPCLEKFRDVAPHRFMVFGNHDYWSADKNSVKHLEILEPHIRKSGFHLLDKQPKKIGNIGFAGNCSWYDYSFAPDPLPPDSSYEKKQYRDKMVWNDARYVHLNKNDKQYTDELLEKLEKDINILASNTETIIAVTHHVGFQEMIIQKGGDEPWNFCNAFMGSRRLGEMLLKYKKVKYHICGHTHYPLRVQKNHLESINPGSTYHEKRYVIINIPD